jgi:hypothetical protein
MYKCDHWYVLNVLVECRRAESRPRRTTRTNFHVYTLRLPVYGLHASPKPVQLW